MVLLLVLGFLVIAAIEVPPLVYRKQKREMWAFWGLMALSFAFSLAVALRWPLPNPTYFLEGLLGPLAKMIELE